MTYRRCATVNGPETRRSAHETTHYLSHLAPDRRVRSAGWSMCHVECFGDANTTRCGRTQYARPQRGGSREAVPGQGGAHVTAEARHEGAERRGTGGVHRVGGGGIEDALGRRPGRRQHARRQPAGVLVSGLHGVCHYQICVRARRGVFEARARGTAVGKGARVTGIMGGARAPTCSRGWWRSSRMAQNAGGSSKALSIRLWRIGVRESSAAKVNALCPIASRLCPSACAMDTSCKRASKRRRHSSKRPPHGCRWRPKKSRRRCWPFTIL